MKTITLASGFAAFLLFPLLSLGASPVNFSGHWKGPGIMSDTKGNKTPCSEIEIVIRQTPDSMKIELYNAQCGQLNSNWGPYLMSLKNGKVFEDDEQIGEIQGNIMKTLSGSSVQYAFNLRLNESPKTTPTLDSYYGVRNALGAIVIEGNLKPVTRE
jgi:hypothetical protein